MAPAVVLPVPVVAAFTTWPAMPPTVLMKMLLPIWRFSKSTPMLRAAVRLISATSTFSMTCCSPGTRSRLTTANFSPVGVSIRKSARPPGGGPAAGAPFGPTFVAVETFTLEPPTWVTASGGFSATLSPMTRRICWASKPSLAWPQTSSLSLSSVSRTTLSGNLLLIWP